MHAIYFGRDAAGRFTLVSKNGWGRDWISTPEELEHWTVSRGKKENWRPAFAKNLADIWRLLEPHCNFRGFVYADVLWNPAKPYVLGRRDGSVFFCPNQVTYTVSPNTDLHTDIIGSKMGIAVHSKFELFGDKDGHPLYKKLDIQSSDVVVVPQTIMSQGVIAPNDMITALEKKIKKHESDLDALFHHRSGLSDFRDIIYRYVNYMNKINDYDNLADITKFKDWIDVSKLSFNKQGRMRDIIDANKYAFKTMFGICLDIVAIKDLVIDSFDKEPSNISSYSMQPVFESYDGCRTMVGGEGYVVQEPKVKLVPRKRWKPNIVSEFDVTDLFS
jgi:hypothetical protein